MHIYTPRPLMSGTPWLWICALRRHRGALTRITAYGPWSRSGCSDRCAPPPDPVGSLHSPGKTAPMRRTASNSQTLRYRRVFSGIWHSQLLSRLVSFSSSLFYYLLRFWGCPRWGWGLGRPSIPPRTTVAPDRNTSRIKLGAFGQVQCSKKKAPFRDSTYSSAAFDGGSTHGKLINQPRKCCMN